MKINHGKSIWSSPEDNASDIYRLFAADFNWNGNEKLTLEIAADSTFHICINGKRCAIQQLADMPGDYTVSTCDITEHLTPGINRIGVEVHYIGEEFLTYQPGPPFLKAVIYSDSQIICATDKTWRCSADSAFQSNLNTRTTLQLGFVWCFDGRKTQKWNLPETPLDTWKNASELPENGIRFSPRQVDQLKELAIPPSYPIQYGYLFREKEENHFGLTCLHDFLSIRDRSLFFKTLTQEHFSGWQDRTKLQMKWENSPVFSPVSFPENTAANGFFILCDLEKEMVGYPLLKMRAPAGTIVDFSHGEHIEDGRIRSSVGTRCFTDRYICHDGSNIFMTPHRRIGARYVSLHITGCRPEECELIYAGMIPLSLPFAQQAEFSCDDRMLLHINKVSIDTLKLCMHEHYEDCPWREQALYGYDSRNQMLYGYYVWGNYKFAKASLDLLGKSFDGDRYLTLTSPGKYTKTIPIFTLAWISAMYEYTLYSGDTSLFSKWQLLIDRIIDQILARRDPEFPDLCFPGTEDNIWNFCEWTGNLINMRAPGQAPFNIYLYETLCSAAAMHSFSNNQERADKLLKTAGKLASAVEKTFYNPEKGYYEAIRNEEAPCCYEHIQAIMLANALVPAEKIHRLQQIFEQNTAEPINLSALSFVTSAMKKSGPEFRKMLLPYIRKILEPIVLSGATSIWEATGGSYDFSNAGSLCHGWSSVMPYICGAVLLGVTPLEPGFKKFEVKPSPCGLPRADGEVPTPYGMIRVSFKQSPEGLILTIRHPKETEPVISSFEEYPIASYSVQHL